MIEARVVCDSISPAGIRLTTMQLRYPKFIHGEFMTHRVFSRNASSSRAVPTAKLLEEARSDALRAAPVFWGKNQPGMQAAEELGNVVKRARAAIIGRTDETTDRELAEFAWAGAAITAAGFAEIMLASGAHKQIVNRLLEPFLHINVVVTATEWDNFFGLRLDAAAQPEMRALAEAMWKVRNESRPEHLLPGDWHLPFVSVEDDWPEINGGGVTTQDQVDVMIRISVARCARVSYLSNDTGRRSTVEEDLKLYDRLLGGQPIHASPAEHQATPDVMGDDYSRSKYGIIRWENLSQHGNLRGWRQYRKMLPNEAVAPLPKEYQS